LPCGYSYFARIRVFHAKDGHETALTAGPSFWIAGFRIDPNGLSLPCKNAAEVFNFDPDVTAVIDRRYKLAARPNRELFSFLAATVVSSFFCVGPKNLYATIGFGRIIIMKISIRLAGCAVGFAALALTTGALAQDAGFTIQIDSTFDYPGTGNQTRPQKINDKGQIAGIFVDGSTGASLGFTLRGTTFSAPIMDPNDAGGLTEVRGINNSGTVCGDYLDSAGAFEGFFLSRHTFTNYDPEPTFTLVLGINNAADFCGSVIPSSTGVQSAYKSIGGVMTDFTVPNASATLAYQINSFNQVCGYYNDANVISHGWWMDSDGTLHAPVDPAGSTTTIIFGNNDSNLMVGRYISADGATHAIVFQPPRRFIVYDFPGATFTSFNGINRSNQITGRYTDPATGIDHGILAHLVRSAAGSAELPLATSPMPVRPSQHPADKNPAY
jgi:hypothetical protein